jgi:hypothetical protein
MNIDARLTASHFYFSAAFRTFHQPPAWLSLRQSYQIELDHRQSVSLVIVDSQCDQV